MYNVCMSNKATVYIEGMHCPSCDILVKDKFRECGNIMSVKADFRKQTAEVEYTGELDTNKLNAKVRDFGYRVHRSANSLKVKEPFSKRAFDAGAIAVILFIIYYFAQDARLIPDFATSSDMSLTAVFLLGLAASTSTCMATSGALYMSTVGKTNGSSRDNKNAIVPSTMFNLGRVLSYGFFGFIVGAVGQKFIENTVAGPVFLFLIAIIMFFIGLDMAGVLPFSSIGALSFTKGIFSFFEKKFSKNPKKWSFFLGAITYLLPCGFTQSVQLYAISLGSPTQSAIIMMVFAIGTVPALVTIGFTSSFTKSKFYPVFSKIIGVIIIMIGFGYLANVGYLYGITPSIFTKKTPPADANVVEEKGVQVAKMIVKSSGYYPGSFTVKKGVPVRWVIEGENVLGCQGSLVAPSINVATILSKGENVIEFLPEKEGRIAFSCSMGMFQGEFNVVEG